MITNRSKDERKAKKFDFSKHNRETSNNKSELDLVRCLAEQNPTKYLACGLMKMFFFRVKNLTH